MVFGQIFVKKTLKNWNFCFDSEGYKMWILQTFFGFLTKMGLNSKRLQGASSKPVAVSNFKLLELKNDINKWMNPWGQKNCIEFPLWKHRIEKVLHTYLNLNFAVSYDAITYFCLFYCNEVSRLCLKNKKKTLVQYVL